MKLLIISIILLTIPVSAIFTNLQPGQIISGTSKYTVTANGITYDTYYTNTAFKDCSDRSIYTVIELYEKDTNRDVASALSHVCVSDESKDWKTIAQELANNYNPSPVQQTPLPSSQPPSQPSSTILDDPTTLWIAISLIITISILISSKRKP